MFDVITNFNFTDVTGQEYVMLNNSDKYSINKAENKIIFKTNFVACPCIYYVKKDNLFCYSFDVDKVVTFANEHNIILTDNYENKQKLNKNIAKHVKVSISKRYKYNVNYIENWEQVILASDGSFEKTDNSFVPFQYEIKDNYDKFEKFILKYKNVIRGLIAENRFLPTLTGGLDTRTLSGLYRGYESELPGYFLMDVKWDGKNNTQLGELELKLAANVAKIIGLPENRLTTLYEDNNFVTITGMFNENADSYENPNDPDYVYKIIQHGWADDIKYNYTKEVVPYIDNEWLQFKQDGETNKFLLLALLRPELINVPFISGAHLLSKFPHGLTISQYPVLNSLKKTTDILDFWGNDKVKALIEKIRN